MSGTAAVGAGMNKTPRGRRRVASGGLRHASAHIHKGRLLSLIGLL